MLRSQVRFLLAPLRMSWSAPCGGGWSRPGSTTAARGPDLPVDPLMAKGTGSPSGSAQWTGARDGITAAALRNGAVNLQLI